MYLNENTKGYLEDKIVNLSADEINEIYNSFDGENDNDIDHFYKTEMQYWNEENDKYKIESEVDYHGGEGEGEDFWKITRILNKETNEACYIKFYGYYDSWDGVEWEGWNLVKPKKVEVIEFAELEY